MLTGLALAVLGAAPLKVALMPLAAGDGVQEKTAQSIGDAVAAEMRRVPGVQLMTGEQLTAVVSVERQRELMGCQSEACMAEIAGALDVDRLVIGSAAKLGSSWILHLQLVDARKAVTLQQSDRRKKGGSIDDVLDELPGMARELLGAGATVTVASNAPPPSPAPNPGPLPVGTADVPYGDVDRAKLSVVEDGTGHLIVFQPYAGLQGPMFFGSTDALYAQRLISGGSQGGVYFNWSFWEPRAPTPALASFGCREGVCTLTCGKRDLVWKNVAKPRAAAMLEKARFFKPRWARRTYALARDDEGTYYFVDRAREPDDNKDFRVYVGSQGEMGAVAAKVLASDRSGDVFGTAQGKLRLSHEPQEAEWIAPAGRQKLQMLDLYENARLIYGELGVYKNQPLGTPCDGAF
jgi:hypothetical protein